MTIPKTYNDIYELVMKNKTVILHNRFGNKDTYFMDRDGKAREKFNQCAATLFVGNDVNIDYKLHINNIEII